MKKILHLILILAVLLPACSKSTKQKDEPLVQAEEAFKIGRYAMAQLIADSLAIGSSFDKLDNEDLCRLSLLFARLGEVAGEEEANIALAARVLEAATARDSDSTAMFISALPPDDRARILIVETIAEAYKHPLHPDSLEHDF